MGATGVTYARALVVHVLKASDTVGDAAKADDTAGKKGHETVANIVSKSHYHHNVSRDGDRVL